MAANKVTVGDVVSAGQLVGTIGSGKTPHLRNDENAATCNGKALTPGEFNAEINICANCAKVFNNNTNENEGTEMATKNDTKKSDADTLAEVTRDVENMIDVLSTLTKTDTDKITAMQAQANAELLKINANKRAGLSMRFKTAVTDAQNRSTTVVVKAETTSVDQIENYAEVVEHTAATVAEGIKSEVGAQEAAKTVASAILDGRLRVFDKKGRPDLKGTRQASKDLSSAIYTKAAEQLLAENYGSTVADVDELLKGLKDKVQYQMTAVLPEFIYSLDNSPEEFANLFPALASEVDENNKASDMVFDMYGVNRKSKAELAADRRAAAKELKERAERGELTSGEAEGDDETESEDNGNTEKTQFEKDSAKLDKVSKDLVKVVENANEYTDEEKDTLRKKISAAVSALSEALTKL
ncbi:hypothetical protein [Streptomyces sp. NPDC094144]|uniref:hypothetical protein n=1 Tax=Streptomyces sp. NPDC094144 TaxID=3366056 RepID=UPI00381CD1CA